MPAPFDYNIQRPDVMGAIGAYEAGRDRNRQVMQQGKQDMFAQYLPGALKGDQQALQGAQQNATPEQQMQLQNALAQMEDAQLQKTLQQQEKFSRLAQWADTPEKWMQATQMAEADGMKGASQVPFEQRGAKLAGMLTVKEQLDQEWKRREFQLRERDTNSAIGARNAAADYSRRRAAAPNGTGGVTVDPETGALIASPNMNLKEAQSKDLAFYQRGVAALAKFDDDRAKSMATPWNATFGEAPFGLGNVLQTQSSRQGKQAAADFLSVILRKDSGAALTKSDFDIYGKIFIPELGDDADTLEQKRASRVQALQSLRAGLGTARILADATPPPLPGLAGGKTPPPPAATDLPPPPPGARIMP